MGSDLLINQLTLAYDDPSFNACVGHYLKNLNKLLDQGISDVNTFDLPRKKSIIDSCLNAVSSINDFVSRLDEKRKANFLSQQGEDITHFMKTTGCFILKAYSIGLAFSDHCNQYIDKICATTSSKELVELLQTVYTSDYKLPFTKRLGLGDDKKMLAELKQTLQTFDNQLRASFITPSAPPLDDPRDHAGSAADHARAGQAEEHREDAPPSYKEVMGATFYAPPPTYIDEKDESAAEVPPPSYTDESSPASKAP